MAHKLNTKTSTESTGNHVYRAPLIYVILFYSFLSAWTIVSVLLLGLKYGQSGGADLTQLLMIGFIFAVTWYFSLGIFYRIRIEENGNIELTGFRRILRTHPQEIELVEGPLFPIGFVRVRLEREKAYLFCMAKNKDLHQVLSLIHAKNPDIKFKSL
ncbi:MAG TPA: hypothetical protein VLK23_03650 [Thermodesulfobacteriota bacterium]|nr:hypothetical protein [Thermodesulfobacteriota bacterium]